MVFEFLELEELLKRPPKQYIFQGLIGLRDLVMIYGTPWSGKTLVAIDLIMSYVTQSPFSCFPFCHENNSPNETILYCTDEGIDGLSARFHSALDKYGEIPLSRIKVCLNLPNLFLPKHKHNVNIFIKELKDLCPGPFSPRIVIIDTLKNASIGSSENSNDDAAIIASAAKQIRDQLDCAVLLIHHTDKAGRWMRGASAFTGDMDCIIKMEEGKMIIEKTKDQGGKEPQAFSIVQINGSVVIEWLGEYKDNTKTYLDCLMQSANGKSNAKTAKEIATFLDVAQSNAIRELKKLASDNGVVYSELLDPNKGSSPHNPMIYWFNDSIWD